MVYFWGSSHTSTFSAGGPGSLRCGAPKKCNPQAPKTCRIFMNIPRMRNMVSIISRHSQGHRLNWRFKKNTTCLKLAASIQGGGLLYKIPYISITSQAVFRCQKPHVSCVFTKALAYAVCRLCAAPTRKLFGADLFFLFCGRVRPFGPSFLSFWPFGYSFSYILAFWACSAFISFHFELLGFHFHSLAFWGCTSLYKYWLWRHHQIQ